MRRQRNRAKKKKGNLLQLIFPVLLVLTIFITVRNHQESDDEINWENIEPIPREREASLSLTEIREKALHLANRDRANHGLSTLKEHPELSQAAQDYAEELLARDFYDHVTPEGQTPKDRVEHISGMRGVGENLVQQKGNFRVEVNEDLLNKFQQGWMDSPGHRENLLQSNFTYFGYGLAYDDEKGELYAVQKFLIK
ncbi:CAP domain-containing protein [Euhalothece natronophila Z-M001]|uniref:CAP domain-containing protein n=1 Tax=Euhalothece natronophila Z-M001 TaxID=522448 RepID=A0A5B8NMV8_9CHRO|nr:CAP domain-containing protein [Euhalothece natronophila]QDZ40276.1 CAP domain-containing protein [Euhalothece natronophila Z-M001]